MQPPIGVSDFRKLITHKDPQGKPYLFVDKSLYIKEILNDSSEVVLITRPRRFGKTLNLSMLHHFFAKEIDNEQTATLFNDLKIFHHKECMKYQGRSPVIFLTFKDIKSSSFTSAYNDFIELIRMVYKEHAKQALAEDSKLDDWDKREYELFLDRKASESNIKSSLKNLTLYLTRCYGVKPILLIDEYDTPIQTAYVGNYYYEMIEFMKEFLGAALKDNSYLDKAVLTGILRISKESLFSGLNNLKVYSLLSARYGEYFGFTEEEVVSLLKKSDLENGINEVKEWYNGYQAGDAVIYNPWSIVNYIQENGKLGSYWINTSDNTLIKKLLIRSNTNFKTQFESLLQDKPIETLIDEHVFFTDIETSESTLWTLLFMSGYLKAIVTRTISEGNLCQVLIPNNEVKGLYQKFIAEWLSGVNSATTFNTFLNNLLNGNMESFEEHLKTIMLQTFSTHDIKGKNPEKFFHGFMLGLVSGIDKNSYRIDSNRESGLGRYDIMIAPSDSQKLGIIIEIKNIENENDDALNEAANDALKQINERQYEMTSSFQNVKRCLKIGIAFSGKHLVVVHHLSFKSKIN